MANWWLDESPYPGPTHKADWSELKQAYFTAGRRIAVGLNVYFEAITDGLAGLTRSTDVAFWGTVSYGPEEIEWESASIEERKAYALRRKQNMGTGPRPQWQFGRNGKKVY